MKFCFYGKQIKAYELFKSGFISNIGVGIIKDLKQIHKYIN